MMLKYWLKTNLIKNNKESLLEASREVSLEINTEKTKCMVGSPNKNTGQNHNLLLLINSLKMLQSLSIWEKQQQIKIAVMKKWKED